MMIAGIGVICWLLIRGRMSNRRRSQNGVIVNTKLAHNANAIGTKHGFTGTSSLGAPPDVLKWQVELHDLGRELKAELDSKLLAVRAMTHSYDRAAGELRDLIAATQNLSLPADSPLERARALSREGWSHEKIASALGIGEADVETLLRI